MKNKIIASLLAVAMFASLAVPTFAAKANGNEVTQIIVEQKEFTVKKGEKVDLAEKVIALKDANQLADSSTLTYSLTNNSDLAFANIKDGEFTAIEDKGSATVTIKSEDGKRNFVVTLKATKEDVKKEVIATGFQFKESLNKIAVGTGAKSGEIVVIPTPDGAVFTPTQAGAIEALANDAKLKIGNVAPTAVAAADYKKVTFTYGSVNKADAVAAVYTIPWAVALADTKTAIIDGVTYTCAITTEDTLAKQLAKAVADYNAAGKTYTASITAGDKGITLTAKTPGAIAVAPVASINGAPVTVANPTVGKNAVVASGLVLENKFAARSESFSVNFPVKDDAAKFVSRRASTKIEAVPYKLSSVIANRGDITVKVGKTIDLAKNIKQGPSDLTEKENVQFILDYVGTDTTYDYIDLVKDDIYLATQVGKVKVTAKAGTQETSFIVHVVPYSADATKTATLLEKATVKVGENLKLDIKDLPEKATVTWKVENTKVQIDKFTGATTTVYPKAEGACKVTATIKDVDGKSTTLDCAVTITAAAKPETKPGKPGTTNPQTGDSLFANLF